MMDVTAHASGVVDLNGVYNEHD